MDDLTVVGPTEEYGPAISVTPTPETDTGVFSVVLNVEGFFDGDCLVCGKPIEECTCHTRYLSAAEFASFLSEDNVLDLSELLEQFDKDYVGLSAEALLAIKAAGKDITVILPCENAYVIVAASIDDKVSNFNLLFTFDDKGTGYKLAKDSIVITPAQKGAFGLSVEFFLSDKDLGDLDVDKLGLWYVNSGFQLSQIANPFTFEFDCDDDCKDETCEDEFLGVSFVLTGGSYYVVSDVAPELEGGWTTATTTTATPVSTTTGTGGTTDPIETTTGTDGTTASGETTTGTDGTTASGETTTVSGTTTAINGTTTASGTGTSGEPTTTASGETTTASGTTASGETTTDGSSDVPTTTTTDEVDPPEYKLGDTNGDDKLTIHDALEILKFLAGLGNTLEEDDAAMAAAKIVSAPDRAPTIHDALEIFCWLAGLNSALDDIWVRD